jgi:DNA-binding transcriptional LysR family regulator
VLTLEGEVYYEGCRTVVERYSALEDKVRTLHQEVAGCVRVASIYSVGLHHMSRYLQEFLSQYPRANVRLEYLHPHRVYQSIEEDTADLGLVSYPKSSRTLSAIEWREEPMVLACAPSNPLAQLASVALRQLHGQKLVGFDSDLTIRREIDRVLHLHRVEVQVAMEFDNIETIKRAVEIDAGVALLPEPTIAREVETGTLVAVPLETRELVRPLGIIHRRGKELNDTAWRFIELLRRGQDGAQAITRTRATERSRVQTLGAGNGDEAAGYPQAGYRNGERGLEPGVATNGHGGEPGVADGGDADLGTAREGTAANGSGKAGRPAPRQAASAAGR